MPFSIPVTKTISKSCNLYTCKLFSRSNLRNLIIYSHGIFEPTTTSTSKQAETIRELDYLEVPPWTSLYFYQPEERILRASLFKLMDGSYEPLEICRPGKKVINYSLSRSTFWPPKLSLFQDRWQNPNRNEKKHPNRLYEIVCPTEPTNLRHILFTLEIKRYLYPMIHCFFCRAHSYEDHSYDPGMVMPPNIYPGKLGRWLIIDNCDIAEVHDRGTELK